MFLDIRSLLAAQYFMYQVIVPIYKFKDEGSVDEFKSLCDGSGYDKKWNEVQLYGHIKMVGTMWILGMARKYPSIRIFVISPGSTHGTNALNNMGR
jgi:hypothetical protein